MKPGKFIVFEGIDGCGKSSQYERLFSYIKQQNKYGAVFATKEPNNLNEYGQKAIAMLKSDRDPYEKGLEAAKLFAENRKGHNDLFIPLLEMGVDVLSDRYWHSNFAYQHAQGVDYRDIAFANLGAERVSKIPDLTLIVDVTVEESIKRRAIRDGEEKSKFENNASFLEKVRRNYLDLSSVIPEFFKERHIHVIDGMGTKDEVWARVLEVYKKRFG